MKKVHDFFIIICIAVSISLAAVRDVAFIGLYGEGAPAIEKNFDAHLRENLSMNTDIRISDYSVSQRYRKLINFGDERTVSSNLVESMNRFASDSTFFVWGIIKTCTITPVRKNIVVSNLKAELTIGLSIYDLARNGYVYIGNITALAYKNKGFIFFDNPKKTIHISALDRIELLDKVGRDAVQISNRMISAVLQNEQPSTSETANQEIQNKAPSISDVFSIPSVGAAEVDLKTNKNEKK
jgi:hypothetical protein